MLKTDYGPFAKNNGTPPWSHQGADTRLIQDYLGHRNIQPTVMYTAANPAQFERLWR